MGVVADAGDAAAVEERRHADRGVLHEVGVGGEQVVEHARAAANRHLAVAADVPGEAEARRDVASSTG